MKAMPVSKLGQRRQVVIPKDICEELGLQQGDFVEVTGDPENGTVVIKPKKLVDPDDILTSREEALVRKAEQEIKRGEVVDWEDVKTELNL
jgi:AbrB family looped-hinge helix DNA binding protein